jgi:MYXO-CTERM domain-containing protein
LHLKSQPPAGRACTLEHRNDLLLAVLLMLELVASSTAHAYCRMTTKMATAGNTCVLDGIPLAWRRQCISFSMISRPQADPPFESVRTVADHSFETWMQVTCGGQKVGLQTAQTAELAACDQPEYSRHEPNANTIIFVQDWAARSLPQDAFGLTLVWHDPTTGEILDADMQLNETLGAFSICDQVCQAGAVDIQNVMTHEAGHFFGLGHSDVVGATMSARATVGETSKRSLADDDRAGLCAIYGNNAAASCTSSDFVPDNGFSPTCAPTQSSSKSGIGCSVTASRGGAAPSHIAALWMLCLAGLGLRNRRRSLS